MYSLTALEARNLKSRCHLGLCALRFWAEFFSASSQLPVVAVNPWHSNLKLCGRWHSSWVSLSLCLFSSPYDTGTIGLRTSLVAQTIKNLPAMQETRVRSLGWEDPLEKGMANHSSILAWRIIWTEEPKNWTWLSDWTELIQILWFKILSQHVLWHGMSCDVPRNLS